MIGRSRGGLSTKINAVVDTLGNPLRCILTAGQVDDIKQAEALIQGFAFNKPLAENDYDSDRLRVAIAEAGAEAVMPSNRARSQAIPYDRSSIMSAIWSSGLSIGSSIFDVSPPSTRRPLCRSHPYFP